MRMRTCATSVCAVLLCLAATTAAQDMGSHSAGLEPIAAADWTLDAAAHLLRRAGFGGTLEEIAALHALGAQGAVDRLLNWDGADENVPRIRIAVTTRPSRDELIGLTQEQRQKLGQEYRRKDYGQIAVVREWWMQSMIRTAHPARERLTLFWHSHFTSSYRDVRNSYHMYMQNTLFRRHAAGNFRTLLHEVTKDPAMLEYLDNNRNRRGAPNENYAREVMELFTLGEGHYTEQDIKEAARALTGWTFVGNRFYEDKRQHDDGEKVIFGKRGNFDGAQFLDLLLEQPQAYRHIATRMFRYFAHGEPSAADIDGLARTLSRHDWKLKPALRQLLLSKEFYSGRSVGTRVKSPVDLIVGLYRSLGMQPEMSLGLSFQADSLGQSLMDPPNVKGWPGGRAWITTSTLLNRYNLCGAIVGLREDKVRTMQTQRYRGMGALAMGMTQADPDEAERADPNDGEGTAPRRNLRDFANRLAPHDVRAAVRAAGVETPAEIVDFFVKTLLSVPATPAMKKTLLKYLFEAEGDARSRLHGLLRLIVSTPEFQLT